MAALGGPEILSLHQRIEGMSKQSIPPSKYAAAFTSALHEGDYRPISEIAHHLYLKSGRRGSLEKYIRYDFPEEIRNIQLQNPLHKEALERFLVELYKAPVRGQIITYISHQIHTLW